VVAAIGHLPDTIEDRSIPIRMKRKPKGVKTEDAFDPDGLRAACTPVRRRLARWTQDISKGLIGAQPERVRGVDNRAWNNWKPLLALAEAAGGEWPSRARAAAIALTAGDSEADTDYAELIGAVKEVFGDREAMSTVDLAKAIARLEDSPRADWWGKDIVEALRNPETADAIYKKLGRRVARDLRDFAKPTQLWIDGRKVRGYRREELQDAFDTYAPEDPSANGRDGSNGRPQVDEGASDQDSTVPIVSTVPTEGSGGLPEGDGAPAEGLGFDPSSNGHAEDRSRRSA
jgi:hypothetical protein